MICEVIALTLCAAPPPSPLASPSRWAVAKRVEPFRDGGFSPLRVDRQVDRLASDVVVEVLADGGLEVSETMMGATYSVVATRVSGGLFRLRSKDASGTWQWLGKDRAHIAFGQAEGDFVRLRPGEGIDDAEAHYQYETTQKYWPEWVGTYEARDGGVMQVDSDKTIKWEGAIVTGHLTECFRNCALDAGVIRCFESDFRGLGEGRSLYLSLEREVDAGASVRWSVHGPCEGPVEVLLRR